MKIVASNSLTLSNVNDGTDAPTITVKSYTYSAGSRAEIELTGPNAFKQTIYNRGHNVWVIDATTHKFKEFVSCDTFATMSFSHNGVSTTLADYLASLKDSIIVIAASDADSVDQNVRDVLNRMGGFPDLGTWGSRRYGHVFIGMSKRNDGTWPLQPRQGYEEAINEDGSAPEIGCTLSKGGIVANGAAGKTQYTHIAYANSSDGVTNFSTSDSNRTYIGMYVDFNINDSNTPSDYSWTLVKGADGTQGTPGKPGADGKTPYFHTAWSYSANGTDRFTTVYPNLNLLDGSKKYTKDNPKIVSSSAPDKGFYMFDVSAKNLKAGTYTMSGKADAPWTIHATNDVNRKDKVGLWLVSTTPGLNWNISLGDTVPKTIKVPKDGDYIVRVNTYSNGKDVVTHKFWDFKLEPGSTATPYMPSSSEVKTADWPRYIGQYTNSKKDDDTNPSKYTWSLIRGNDGKDGATGKDGVAGKDGVGIKTTVITYAISTSETTAPSTGWTSSVPSLVKGHYLWTKTVWTYTDNSSETGYSVSYISKDGNNGHDGIAGKDGVGIKKTTITYASHTNGTTAPATGYTTTVPSVPSGQFLWTKTIWTYTDNTSETGYSVAMMGLKGDKGDPGNNGTNGIAGKDGKGIKATAITYQASTNGTTAPTGTWSASVPTVAKGSFLWTRTIWTYTDNTTETGYAVAYMGTNGNNGTDGIAGKDGVGIKTMTITYAGSTNGTTPPSSGWTSTVPKVAAGSYLWTKTVWDYTDKTSETGYSVSKFGEKGDRGDRGIQGLQGPNGTQGIPGPKGVDGTDAPTITVKSYTYSAGSRAEIELTGPNAFKQTIYNRGHNVWVIDATTHKLKEFVSCDTFATMSFSHNGVSATLADYLTSLKDSIVVIAAADADAVNQNVRDVLNRMGGFPDLGTWGSWRVGHVFIGMSKRSDGTWPLQPRQGYEEVIKKDGSAPEIGCTLSKGGIVANGAPGQTSVVHWAYSDNADGTGFTTTDNGQRYIGHYSDYTQADSTNKTKYRWADRWAKIDSGGRNYFKNSRSRTYTITSDANQDYRTFIYDEFWKNDRRFIKSMVRISLDIAFSPALPQDISTTVHFSASPWYSVPITFKGNTTDRQHFDLVYDLRGTTNTYKTDNVFIRFNNSFPINTRVYIDNANLYISSVREDYKPAVEELEDALDSKADQSLTQEQINALSEKNQILEAEMQAKASMEAFSEFEKTYQSFVKANEDGQAKAESDLIEAGRRIELLTTQFGGLAELKTFIDTYMSSSNEGLIIGKNDASSTIKVSSDRISMFSAGEEVMYISQGVININNGIFTASVQIGKFRTEQYHLNADMNVIRYVGG